MQDTCNKMMLTFQLFLINIIKSLFKNPILKVKLINKIKVILD